MQRQQFVHRPAMVCDPCRHGRRGLVLWENLSCGVQKVIHCAHHKHPLVQGQVWRASARHRRASGARRSLNVAFSRSKYAVLITPSPCDRRRRVSTRAGVPSTMRRSVATTCRPLVVFDDLGDQDMAPARSRGRPPMPMCTDPKRLLHGAMIVITKPSVQIKRGRHAAQRPYSLTSRRIRGMSRCALTSPPSHKAS